MFAKEQKIHTPFNLSLLVSRVLWLTICCCLVGDLDAAEHDADDLAMSPATQIEAAAEQSL